MSTTSKKKYKQQMSKILVKKRSGEKVELDYEKIHNMIEQNSMGLDISVSDVAISSNIQFVNGDPIIDSETKHA